VQSPRFSGSSGSTRLVLVKIETTLPGNHTRLTGERAELLRGTGDVSAGLLLNRVHVFDGTRRIDMQGDIFVRERGGYRVNRTARPRVKRIIRTICRLTRISACGGAAHVIELNEDILLPQVLLLEDRPSSRPRACRHPHSLRRRSSPGDLDFAGASSRRPASCRCHCSARWC